MANLKNSTSTSRNTFDAIQKTLLSHKARNISFDSDGSGRITAITFVLEIQGQLLRFRLPARVENVERIFLANSRNYTLSDNQKEQAYRTAWANIRDWIAAQMALIDTEMARAEEVFLPYLLNERGQTFYEAMAEQQFLLPERIVREE